MEVPQEPDILDILLPFVGVLALIVLGVILLYHQFQRNLFKKELEQEALKNQHQQELLRSAIAAQEAERKRMSQDLHDELGANLSISRMQLKGLEPQVAPELTEQVTGIREAIEHALSATRSISHALMPPELLKLGLEQSLRSLASRLVDAGLEVQVAAVAEVETLSWPTQLGLYRIYAEWLNNTIKHAGATTVQIAFTVEHDQLRCTYQDNGRGLGSTNPGSGLGLKSVEARVQALHGTLTMPAEVSSGFYAEILIPRV